MEKKQLVFLGAKPIGFYCFRYLLEQQEKLGVEVVGLATRQRAEFSGESDLAALAQEYAIPLIKDMEELPECDIIYSVQHPELFKQKHLEQARQIAVNLHLAPLPEYRGCNQFSFAILDDAKEFGATIHQLDERIDHGDVLFEKRFPIPEPCWVNELYDLTVEAAKELFTASLPALIGGDYTPVSQQSFEGLRPSSLHFRKEAAAIKKIDLSWEKEKIEKHIRATSMPGFEPPFCYVAGQKVYFKLPES